MLGCAGRGGHAAWQPVEIPTDADFRGIWFTDSLDGWITGGGYDIEGGIVGRTRDGGRSWSFRSGVVLPGPGVRFGLGRVQFRDTLRGCVVGSSGIVLVTSDGGASWRPVREGRSAGDDLADLQFIDERNGWAAGPASVVRTDDGGETWRTLVRNASENGYLTPSAIHFLDAAHGWLVGHVGTLMRTDDGGNTWTAVGLPLPAGERPTLWDVTFADRLHGWVAGERGAMFRTVDGGASWAAAAAGIPVVRALGKGERRRPRDILPELESEPDRLSLFAVRFADAARGWAVGSYADVAESVVLRSVDGGESWAVEATVPGEELRALFVLDPRHAWAVGDRARTTPQHVFRFVGR